MEASAMNRKFFGLVGAACLLGPIGAHAQTEILNYVATGTGYTGIGLQDSTGNINWSDTPLTGPITAQIVLSGPLSAPTLVSWNVGFDGIGGNGGDAQEGTSPWFLGSGLLELTTNSQGAITGANVNQFNFIGSQGYTSFDIMSGAAMTQTYQYTGGMSFYQAYMVNSTPGVWTVSVPEIDSAFALSGIVLLLGGMAVLRGRRA
jgi:hypothetical protein